MSPESSYDGATAADLAAVGAYLAVFAAAPFPFAARTTVPSPPGVHPRGEGGLRREDAAYLPLVLRRRLPHEGGVVYQAVLRRVVLRLERAEERLLGAEDLYRRRRLLRQVHERPRVRDETRADELAEEDGQVRRYRAHAVLQVVEELDAVLGHGQYLLGEALDVDDVEVGHLGAHGDLCGLLDGGLDGLLLQYLGQVVVPEFVPVSAR